MVLGKIESRSIKWGLAQGAMLISFFWLYPKKLYSDEINGSIVGRKYSPIYEFANRN